MMKHCAREADRKERVYETARRALAEDCRRELSPSFLTQIRSNLVDPQKKLFSESLSEVCASGAIERGGQVLEQEVIANLRRREAVGQTGKDAAVGALSDALARRKESQFLAMKGHWMKKAGPAAAPAVNAAQQALQALSTSKMASQILEGTLDEAKSGKKNVDLDEDLRAAREEDTDAD
jgi:hypothetical protein